MKFIDKCAFFSQQKIKTKILYIKNASKIENNFIMRE